MIRLAVFLLFAVAPLFPEHATAPDPDPAVELVSLDPEPLPALPSFDDYTDLGYTTTDWSAYFADEAWLPEQDYQTLLDVKFRPYLDC
jgi:hypothetical protein